MLEERRTRHPADPGAAVALLRRAVELDVELIDAGDACGPPLGR